MSKIFRGLAGFIAIGLLVAPVLVLKDFDSAKNVGYLGFFLSSYIGGGTYILPFIVNRLDPFALLLIGTFGNTIDEVFGWYAGGLSLSLDEKTKIHKTLQTFVKKYGILAVFLLGMGPFPQFVYTISAFAAGHHKIPVLKFLGANFTGKFIRNAVYILILLYFTK